MLFFFQDIKRLTSLKNLNLSKDRLKVSYGFSQLLHYQFHINKSLVSTKFIKSILFKKMLHLKFQAGLRRLHSVTISNIVA